MPADPVKKRHRLEYGSFFTFGVITNFMYSIFLAAASDICDGESANAAVLCADVLPSFLVTLVFPYFMYHIPYTVRIDLCVLLSFAGTLATCLVDIFWVQLLGIVLASISTGWSEISFLAMSSYYEKAGFNGWGFGSGFAGVISTGYYFIVHTLCGVDASVSILAMCWVPFVMSVFWHFVLPKPEALLEDIKETNNAFKQRCCCQSREEQEELLGRSTDVEQEEEIGTNVSDASSQPFIEVDIKDSDTYWALPTKFSFKGYIRLPIPACVQPLIDEYQATDIKAKEFMKLLSLRQKLSLLGPMLYRYMISLLMVHFLSYTINTGVAPALCNNELGLNESDVNVIVQLLYRIGATVTRSSVSWFYIPAQNMWVFAFTQLAIFLLLFFVPVTDYLWSYPYIFSLCLVEGCVDGMTYSHTFMGLKHESHPLLTEYNMSAVVVANYLGILLSAIVSFWVQEYLDSANGFLCSVN